MIIYKRGISSVGNVQMQSDPWLSSLPCETGLFAISGPCEKRTHTHIHTQTQTCTHRDRDTHTHTPHTTKRASAALKGRFHHQVVPWMLSAQLDQTNAKLIRSLSAKPFRRLCFLTPLFPKFYCEIFFLCPIYKAEHKYNTEKFVALRHIKYGYIIFTSERDEPHLSDIPKLDSTRQEKTSRGRITLILDTVLL